MMIKLVYCVRRRHDVTSEEFYRYWLEEHGPLVRDNAARLKMKKYVQSHTFIDDPVASYTEACKGLRNMSYHYDGITECWWDHLDDLSHAVETPELVEAQKLLVQDESSFVDLEKSTVFFTREHTIFDTPGTPDEG